MNNLKLYTAKDVEPLFRKRRGELKFGESVEFVTSLEELEKSRAKYVLLGIPEDVGVLANYGKKGTSHGSGYNYDTHIPIIFFGNGIKKGSSVRAIEITDIAPTLSMILGISLPNAATGQPLIELFD